MVDWALAERVAAGALILKPAPATYRSRDLQGQFDELTARAETLTKTALLGAGISSVAAIAGAHAAPEQVAVNNARTFPLVNEITR